MKTRGFTYVGMLAIVAILSITASASVVMGEIMERRSAEEELLRIGAEYRRALQSYASTNGGRHPASFQDLLRDPSSAGIRRHLRQLYADPMTGSDAWGVVTVPGEGIAGIYSLSTAQPIRTTGFAPEFAHFADARTYRDWVFTIDMPTPAAARAH